MKRKLNYTGRKRIERERISISLNRQNGSIISFNLKRLDIDALRLPPEAKILVEAYYRTELKRFDFGTVARITKPQDLTLTDLAYPENLKFRILVVDPLDSRILAHATGIFPERPAERRSILPVEFKDIGNQIWRVEYEGEGGSPILCINKKVPNIENIAKQDQQFFIYVYPAVVREILMHMIFVDRVDSVTDPAVDWHRDWLRFSETLGIIPPRELNPENENFDRDATLEWINNVVTTFCNTHTGKFHEYVQKLEEVS